VEHTPPDHGRIETRKIWTTTELNDYLRFPHVGQAFVVERQVMEKKSSETPSEIAYGITSRPPEQAHPQRGLKLNRGHWTIENPSWRATTFWIGPLTKTAAASVPATAPKT
jgi:hypothetical protein